MKGAIGTFAAAILVGGCVMHQAQPSAMTNEEAYSGEVWTWNERENTVTLRQGAQTFRVKVTPEQMRTLRLHESAVVRGELAPPAPIASVTMPAPPMTAIPTGTGEQAELTGKVVSRDPKGVVTIDSPRGPVVVWVDPQDQTSFSAGTPVRVRMNLQPVEMVPTADPRAQAAMASSNPAAFAPGEPGDHSVVTGRILRVDPSGAITIDSPRGPVTVIAPDAARFKVGTTLQVRTLVQPSS